MFDYPLRNELETNTALSSDSSTQLIIDKGVRLASRRTQVKFFVGYLLY